MFSLFLYEYYNVLLYYLRKLTKILNLLLVIQLTYTFLIEKNKNLFLKTYVNYNFFSKI